MTVVQPHQAISLRLASGDVHLWYASLAADATEIASYALLLSDDEAARADRYVFDAHRARFTTGRGILREILSRYTQTPPERIAFDYGAQGKPELIHTDDPPLRFNLTHSEDTLLIGVTRGQMIGVDIEHVRPLQDLMQISRRFFSAREVTALHSLSADQQAVAFFNGWTRKEAVLKAYGDGISEILNTVEVSLLPGEPAAVFSIRGSREEAARWSLHALNEPSGYIASLVVEQPLREITSFCYQTM
jgi:4'-phosphopantetheinyl transferase